ncbi:MAG: DNA alkylation repair protein [Ruminococcaceae bacterium]|nr:DNA alkylation repair protein [Oscillospiraceae bacterium]
MINIQQKLLEFQDKKYKQFNSKLIPNISPDTQIGVRIPHIRKIAKELKDTDEAKAFLNALPHKYFEENNLHGYLLEMINNFDKALEEIEKFLPYIDNWATCDTITPKIFRKNLPALYEKIKVWLKSDETYTIRFGVNMLMKFFLDENFTEEVLLLVAEIRSEEYYVNTVRAWFFATAIAKQREATLPYLENKTLDKWTHNKTIQKCIESFRITKEDKSKLKEMKL